MARDRWVGVVTIAVRRAASKCNVGPIRCVENSAVTSQSARFKVSAAPFSHELAVRVCVCVICYAVTKTAHRQG